MLVGYGRVSSTDQDYATQEKALRDAGCGRIYAEKRSGNTTEGRVELIKAIESCSAGDVLVVVRLDRLARSLSDLLGIMGYLDDHKIGFRCLTQPVDTTTPAGRLMMQMLGAFAQFEQELRRERQRIGIEAAKKRGVYKRPSRWPVQKIRHMRYVRRFTVAMIAREVGCSERTVTKIAPDGRRSSNPSPIRLSAETQ